MIYASYPLATMNKPVTRSSAMHVVTYITAQLKHRSVLFFLQPKLEQM